MMDCLLAFSDSTAHLWRGDRHGSSEPATYVRLGLLHYVDPHCSEQTLDLVSVSQDIA
jgi:hypothetical protein